MRFSKLHPAPYRVTETDGAIVISAWDQKVNAPGATPLMQGDAGSIIQYLDRYFFERQNGRTMQEAHPLALQTANITDMRKAPVITPLSVKPS